MKTEEEFRLLAKECRQLFERKLGDYGASWRLLRPSSLTDQIFIKAKRIRTLETTDVNMVGEGIRPELIGIINYSIVGLIQLAKGYSDEVDMSVEEAMKEYDTYMEEAIQLMKRKNHDYGEAWRGMRCSSYTDLILTKLNRTKQIENHEGKTDVSEGIDANYYDMLNYAMFYMIKMLENESKENNL